MMARASLWHVEEDNMIKDAIFEYAGVYPMDDDLICDLFGEDELTEDETSNEDAAVLRFFDKVAEQREDLEEGLVYGLLSGELTVGELCAWWEDTTKRAAITSQQDRAKMKQYRLANKQKLRRAAKKRRMLISKGQKLKMKRVGSAAGGYSYVMDAGSMKRPKSSAPAPAPTLGSSKSSFNFNPTKQMSSIASTTKMGWK